MNLKRDLVKYVRDKAKSGYKKETECYICGDTERLEFHHFFGMTELLETWLKAHKITINSADEIMNVRETFIAEHINEIYHEAATLCKSHHMRLHSIYGKRPKLATAAKQKRWVDKQRIKNGMV
jgi:queuine/archaeosine tRNA-ribosyltransferase|tara:strand:+ start:155 stop:526 length:372 start_codon:yes stop_codon:yes gene_type:complete